MIPLDDLEFTISPLGGKILDRTETRLTVEYPDEATARAIESQALAHLDRLRREGLMRRVRVLRHGCCLTTLRGV